MSKMIYRINGGTTVVQASAMACGADLEYAVGFLANHRLYKMSKGHGVTKENAQLVLQALLLATERFQVEVIDALSGKSEMKTISRLGEGKVINPWEFVKK